MCYGFEISLVIENYIYVIYIICKNMLKVTKKSLLKMILFLSKYHTEATTENKMCTYFWTSTTNTLISWELLAQDWRNHELVGLQRCQSLTLCDTLRPTWTIQKWGQEYTEPTRASSSPSHTENNFIKYPGALFTSEISQLSNTEDMLSGNAVWSATLAPFFLLS